MPSSRICGCTRQSSRTRSIGSAGACARAAPPAAPRCRGGPDETPADRIPVQAPLRRGPCEHLPEDIGDARRRRRGGRRDRRQRAGHRPLERPGGARPLRAEADLGHPDEHGGRPARPGRRHRESVSRDRSAARQGDRRPDSRGRRGPDLLTPLLDRGPLVVKPFDGTCGLGVRVVHTEAELLADARPEHKPPPILAQRYHPPQGRDLTIYVIGERLFGVRKVFPARTEAEKYGEPFTPTAEQADIALRCGRAFGIDLYGVDLIESEGRTYVVDMSSIPGFKGVPDAPSHLASYFYAAAERAASGRPVFQPAVEAGP